MRSRNRRRPSASRHRWALSFSIIVQPIHIMQNWGEYRGEDGGILDLVLFFAVQNVLINVEAVEK